ncbi:C2H2-type zinc finger protein [Candidatus Nitrososphaera evergladensis]|uniref:C2H2-type zinc finger protein n=1 Tax=Candidatus Nitrososphaera evergladensis TaxID=1459637 RepID=UPI0011E5FEDA
MKQNPSTYIKTFKCKVCSAELASEQRLENHKKVHSRGKKKIYAYGDPYLTWLAYQEIQSGFR